MNTEIMAKIAEGVSGGAYSLLLGAGASIGSMGGNGEPLPSGPGLTRRLIDEFTIPVGEQSISLTKAYRAAKNRDTVRLEKLIRAWFTDCRPDWQSQLVEVDWHRIWTLNIDDIIEVACRERSSAVDRFTWTSKFWDRSSSQRQIIHLHGYARSNSDPDDSPSELVFSVQEYVSAVKNSMAWHTVFIDEFAQRPFIILGASLVDEFDLQPAFAASASANDREYPSVIVLKDVSSLEREELSDLGLIIVESEARSFMEKLYAAMGSGQSGKVAGSSSYRELLLAGEVSVRALPAMSPTFPSPDAPLTPAVAMSPIDRRCPNCKAPNARLRRDWYSRARPMRCLACNGAFGETRVKRCPACGSQRSRLRRDWYRRARPMRCRDCNMVYGGADERAPSEPVVSNTPNLDYLLVEAAKQAVDHDTLADRARGVMMGLAAGNLLGLRTEGWSHERILAEYPAGIRDIDPKELGLPMDDDLAQAIELAEALLDEGDTIDEFSKRLVCWRHQNGRGMGRTTRQSIAQLEDGMGSPHAAYAVYRAKGNIAPNGGIMRCAPVAVRYRMEPALLTRVSADTCAVTHYSPLSQWSCVIVNAVIAILLCGCEPDLQKLLRSAQADGFPDLLAAGRGAGIDTTVLESAASGRSMPEITGWMRENQSSKGHTVLTLQSGLWAAATQLSFEEALAAVVNAGGDTDTNGAMAGAVLGARYGTSAIPLRWRTYIAQKERLADLAERLLAPAGRGRRA